jgi:hypothetical protein
MIRVHIGRHWSLLGQWGGLNWALHDRHSGHHALTSESEGGPEFMTVMNYEFPA